MNDQAFINTYVRILNDTLTEAFNKNIVLQAQLEVATANANKASELENRLRELAGVVSENEALRARIIELTNQVDLATKKYNSLESFKRELVEARAIIKAQSTELHHLKYGTQLPEPSQVEVVEPELIESVDVDVRKKKKIKTKEETTNLISVNETF